MSVGEWTVLIFILQARRIHKHLPRKCIIHLYNAKSHFMNSSDITYIAKLTFCLIGILSVNILHIKIIFHAKD